MSKMIDFRSWKKLNADFIIKILDKPILDKPFSFFFEK